MTSNYELFIESFNSPNKTYECKEIIYPVSKRFEISKNFHYELKCKYCNEIFINPNDHYFCFIEPEICHNESFKIERELDHNSFELCGEEICCKTSDYEFQKLNSFDNKYFAVVTTIIHWEPNTWSTSPYDVYVVKYDIFIDEKKRDNFFNSLI